MLEAQPIIRSYQTVSLLPRSDRQNEVAKNTYNFLLQKSLASMYFVRSELLHCPYPYVSSLKEHKRVLEGFATTWVPYHSTVYKLSSEKEDHPGAQEVIHVSVDKVHIKKATHRDIPKSLDTETWD